MGDRIGRIKTTLKRLQAEIRISQISSVYELGENANVQRSALGTTDFERWAGGLSVVLRGECAESAQEIFKFIQRVERLSNNTTRCVGIDLLFYDDFSQMTPELTLPHPDMHRRPQVLIPAAEIAPDLQHAVLQKSLSELSLLFEKAHWGRYYSAGHSLL